MKYSTFVKWGACIPWAWFIIGPYLLFKWNRSTWFYLGSISVLTLFQLACLILYIIWAFKEFKQLEEENKKLERVFNSLKREY